MQKIMGTADRLIRTLIALGIAALYFTGRISGTLAIVLGIVAIIFPVTSFVARCPAYLPFGISTQKERPGSVPACRDLMRGSVLVSHLTSCQRAMLQGAGGAVSASAPPLPRTS
ncbi:MAG: DUF2892 domain-containing protein [Gemmatimonadota bacterium]